LKKKTGVLIAVSIASFSLLLAGLSFASQSKPATAVTKAVAVLSPTEGNKVNGLVVFTQEGDKVSVSAHIEGLTPGNHGFHIHEFGDCSAKDGASAGGHFNPSTLPHGARTDAKRHAGDLGNIEVGSDGTAHVEFSDSVMKLEGPSSILGRGVIVHANPDDFKTQPTGNAGGRQACGVIGVAKP
jgi:superoxide dismutase, Cu-Zn family